MDKSNELANKKEEEALKMLASMLLSYTLQDLEKAKMEDELMEVICNAKEEISDS